MVYCETSLKSAIQVCYPSECLVAMEVRSEAVCGIAGGKENERRVWGISILKRQHESSSYRSLHWVLLCFFDTVHSCNRAFLCVNYTLHCREVQRGGAAFTTLQWLSSYFLPFRALKEVLLCCPILHYKLVPNIACHRNPCMHNHRKVDSCQLPIAQWLGSTGVPAQS